MNVIHYFFFQKNMEQKSFFNDEKGPLTHKLVDFTLTRTWSTFYDYIPVYKKKGKRKVQGVSQSQTAALPKPQEEEVTDKSKQAQTEQTYEKH